MSLSESDEAPPSKADYPWIFPNNQVLENVSSVKYLGITFTDDLDWDQHINFTSKATKTLGFLRRNLTLAPKETKVAAYTALVPIRVCSTYMEPHHQTEINRIEKVQRTAAGPVDAGVTRVMVEQY